MRELNVRVGSNGYSVPSGLKGKRVSVRIYEWQIEVWHSNRQIETLSRIPGAHHYHINYRHIIDSLLRKPGGFRNYRHREDLFPQDVFRQAWEALNQRLSPRQADLTYLRILKLAATGLETDVAQSLGLLLADPEQNPWNEKTILDLTQATAIPLAIPPLRAQAVNLCIYDQLLPSQASHVCT